MADLDVSDVLDDPDFQTSILVKRTAVTPTCDGTSTADPAWIPTPAVVIPSRGRDLVQTPEGEHVAGDITVYTRRDLTAGLADVAADVIGWDGAFYKVVNAQPWRYGAGYTRAVCQQIDLNPSLFGPDGGEPHGSALDPYET